MNENEIKQESTDITNSNWTKVHNFICSLGRGAEVANEIDRDPGFKQLLTIYDCLNHYEKQLKENGYNERSYKYFLVDIEDEIKLFNSILKNKGLNISFSITKNC